MLTTSKTLLERLRQGDARAWDLWVTVYEPWLRDYLLRNRLQPSDADDVLQNVLIDAHRGLAAFRHNGRRGAFRKWLKTILRRRLTESFSRAPPRELTAELAELLADEDGDPSRGWDREHDRQLARRLLGVVQTDFESHVWEAFRLYVLEGLPAAEVARRTGTTVGAIYTAKHRVLARLRQEVGGMLDD